MAIERIQLNLIPTGKMPVCHTKQYDKGREIGIDLLYGLKPYYLTDEALELDVRKSDNHLVTIDVPYTEGTSSVVFATTEQMCAVSGSNICALKVTKGGVVIGSLNFVMEVEKSVLEGGLPSESDIENLETQMTAIIDPMLDDLVPPIVEELVPQVVGNNYYNKTEINTIVDGIDTALEGIGHDIDGINDDIDNLETELESKADASSLAEVATSGSYNDLTDKPTIPEQMQSDWNEEDNTKADYIKNKPNLSTVATSGNYNDLSNKPTIPAAQVNSDWNADSGVSQILNKPNLSKVATTGDYNDLNNKPSVAVIDDTEASASKVYSSEKVVDLLGDKASARDLQTVSNDVTSLKNDVYGVTTETEQTLTANKYYNTASVLRDGATTYSEYVTPDYQGTYCLKVAVIAGQKYKLIGVGGSQAVGFYILTGTNNRVVSSSTYGSRTTPTILDITENGYLYVNLFNYSSSTDKVILITHTVGFEDEINDLKDITEDLSNETTGEETDTEQTLTPNKYINMTEVFRDGATTFVGYQNAYSGCYCATIKVQANEIYTLHGAGSGNAMGLYVLTDVDGLVLSSVKMGSRDFPTVVNINQSGYLYVNLTYYDSDTDKIVKSTYANGIIPSIKNLNLTLPFFGKKIVNFGDSIIGQRRPPFDVSTVLADLTGATVYNCGFGGCRMAKHTTANYDAFSMYRLAYAIAHNDWSVQDAVDFSQLPTYFAETLSLLKTIDFSKVDSITIGYGTNDLTGDVGLDDNNDPDNTNYFGGALRYSLDLLMSAFPNLKVFVCGQTYRFWSSGGVFTEDSDTYTNANSNTLIDFVDKTKAISHDYHLQFIDNYFDLGINKLNRSNWFLANDGTHHNYKGAHLIAEHIARLMF